MVGTIKHKGGPCDAGAQVLGQVTEGRQRHAHPATEAEERHPGAKIIIYKFILFFYIIFIINKKIKS